MINFHCPSCGVQVWFDTISCERCALDLAYAPDLDAFVALSPSPASPPPLPCANRPTVEQCNWVRHDSGRWCRSCELDLDHTPTISRAPFQEAKRRSLRQMIGLGVDVSARLPHLAFDLRPSTPSVHVVTGHADGLITIDTAEAEAAHREEIRAELGEPYRTPLGHVRHELGHWWWATAFDQELDPVDFRQRFGDERADYQQSLADHYATPDDGSWRDGFISFYAASHPWEDFAESFAHVLHVDDTFETAVSCGFVQPGSIEDFAELYPRWVDFTVSLNALNRSMGVPDPYPFVVAPTAVEKMAAVIASLTMR